MAKLSLNLMGETCEEAQTNCFTIPGPSTQLYRLVGPVTVSWSSP